MNNKTVMSVVLALALASGGSAFGQGNSGHNDRGDGNDRGRHEQGPHGGQQDRHDNQRYQSGRHDDRGRGAGPNNSFYRGDRLPDQYRGRQYVVDDWRGHHLSAPPRGYHWVQSGGDYILVAVATGIIMQLLLNN